MTTKFVILCQPRTGSSLLNTSLRAHAQIVLHREILNHRQKHDLPDEGYRRLVVALDVGSHPSADENPDVRAVGCNLHAFQPDRGWDGWPRWEPAWDALAGDPSIKVVHLRRLDTIAQFASWKIAGILKRWGEQSDVTERPTVRIDPGELRWFEQWNRAVFEWRLSRLRRHELLSVTYESLRDDWDATIRRVQEFLGVEPLSLKQAVRKNETRPLAEVVENYREIVDRGHTS